VTVQEKKVVLITDVFSSVGLATAILLSRSGHKVFGAVADRSTAPDTPYLSPVELDVRRDESVTHAIADVLQEAGRIDALVNNATISVVGGLEETSISQSCEVFETNFFGALRVTYAVLPHMRLRGVGRILNISSVLGILPGPFLGICAASQFALEGWSATLDHELRSTGIRVSTIRTGLSKTDIGASIRVPDRPLGRYLTQRSKTLSRVRRALGASVDDEIVAEVVERALLDRIPKTSYSAGLEAKTFSILKRFAPSSVVDFVMRRQLRVE
jgi:NAD(P)-dependent dehydrogenase (short-subunit alcohol dehydrogenase family)